MQGHKAKVGGVRRNVVHFTIIKIRNLGNLVVSLLYDLVQLSGGGISNVMFLVCTYVQR